MEKVMNWKEHKWKRYWIEKKLLEKEINFPWKNILSLGGMMQPHGNTFAALQWHSRFKH